MNRRRRTYLILVGLIFTTLPCYCLGIFAYQMAPSDVAPTSTVEIDGGEAPPVGGSTPIGTPVIPTAIATITLLTTPGTLRPTPTLRATPGQFQPPAVTRAIATATLFPSATQISSPTATGTAFPTPTATSTLPATPTATPSPTATLALPTATATPFPEDPTPTTAPPPTETTPTDTPVPEGG